MVISNAKIDQANSFAAFGALECDTTLQTDTLVQTWAVSSRDGIFGSSRRSLRMRAVLEFRGVRHACKKIDREKLPFGSCESATD